MKNVKAKRKSLDSEGDDNSTGFPSQDAKCDQDGLSIEPETKRTKRGKYASRACGQCKRRKIKCDGNDPCKSCVAKRCECQREGADMRGRWRQPNETAAYLRAKNLNYRKNQFDGQLHNMGTPVFHTERHQDPGHKDQFIEPQSLPDDTATGSKRPLRHHTTSPTVPTFSGETSLTHNLTVVEGRLEQMGVRYARLRSTSPNQPFASRLTPSPCESPNTRPRHQTQGYIYQLLDPHGIVPDRKQWDQLMHIFCDEVHILVPFLHLPSLWEAYSKMWENSRGSESSPYHRNAESRFTLAHVLLCLANGKCVISSRANGPEGHYSAGWSLYRAARDIFGDLLDVFSECSNQILLLQTILLMVVYLFRIDAHGPAEKLLALSISHSHHIGLQRYQVVEKLGIFESEIARRFWWCIYLMDRRLAIETGRPFLIQDVNIDIGLPRTVSDEWLSRYRGTSHLIRADDTASERSHTTMPYLIAMASYSRVIGKVWEALYGASTAHSSPSSFLNEYLELLITQSQKDLQPEFSYDPRRPGSYRVSGLAWWQIKQQLIMRIVSSLVMLLCKRPVTLANPNHIIIEQRWASLYLLIRKPMLQRAGSLHSPEATENEVICMRLVQGISDDFKNVPEDHHPKYTFPFLHYLTSATIIALGLIMKQHSFRHTYGKMTLETARSLKKHCHRTWVSGKMARAVWRLNQMAEATLSPKFCSPEDQNSNQKTTSLRVSPQSHQSLGMDEHLQDHPIPPEQMLLKTVPKADTTISASHRRISRFESDCQLLPGQPQCSNHADWHSKITKSPNLENDEMMTNDFDFEEGQKVLHLSSGGQRKISLNETNTLHGTQKGEMNPVHSENLDLSFQGKEPNTMSGSYAQELGPFAPDPNAWLPGETIDGGMEWLQTLFANDLDTDLPFDWT